MNQKHVALILAALLFTIPMHAASCYPVRLGDPKAVYLTRDSFPVHADGIADDADALQQAINRVQETTHQGIVFIPGGKYRLGQVYAFRPDGREDEITILQPVAAVPRPGLVPVLPINRWRDAHDFIKANAEALPLQSISPDGTTFIPVMKDFRSQAPMRGYQPPIDIVRAYGLAAAPTNRPFYVADEFGQKTWKFSVMPDGSLTDPKLFDKEGEAGITSDASGNVYVAAGNVFVFDRSGKQIDLIEVPERPTNLMLGGKDRQTLFFAARSSLYGVNTRFKGQ